MRTLIDGACVSPIVDSGRGDKDFSRRCEGRKREGDGCRRGGRWTIKLRVERRESRLFSFFLPRRILDHSRCVCVLEIVLLKRAAKRIATELTSNQRISIRHSSGKNMEYTSERMKRFRRARLPHSIMSLVKSREFNSSGALQARH